MPKKKEPPLTSDEQRKRFEDLAIQSGAKSSANTMRKVIKTITAKNIKKQ